MLLSIDDQVSEFSQEPERKIGDFIQSVVSQIPPNRIITNIQVNGRKISKFLEPESIEGTLREVRELQIHTVDMERLAISGIDVALSTIDRLKLSLLNASELFREERNAEGNQIFSRCIEGLEKFLETIVVTRSVMKLDFSKILVDGLPLSQIESELSSILAGILKFQEVQDYLGVADKVEYELLTNFYSWDKALKQLRLSSSSNA